VNLAGKNKSFAIAKGTVFLQSECDGEIHTLRLNNVLHIPNTDNSLLSLGCWEQSFGRQIHAQYGKITLLTEKGIAVARGIRLSNRLYQMAFTISREPADAEYAFHAQAFQPSWEVWHRKYAHVSYSGLQHLLDNKMVDGFDVDTSTDKPDCVACTEAKLIRSPYGPATDRFTKPGELMHVDLWGKYDKISIHGNKYYLLLVDDASRFVTVEFLKSKHQAAQKIKDHMTHLMSRGMSPCAIRMDRGTEFVNEELRTWCHSKGVRYQMTAPYSPAQNGVAERMNRTLEELSRAMLIESKLPEFLWEPAVAHAAYVRNMCWTKHNPTKTPYQLWHG
jgi:transposase InsO family protein